MYYENLTKLYPISKTIRNELIPVGKTLENIKKNNILEADTQRKDDYKHVKKLMDDYHKQLIDESLQNVHLADLAPAAEIYMNVAKDKGDTDAFSKYQDKLRKEVVKHLKEHENYSLIGSKDIIKLLQKLHSDEADYNALESFNNFFTYFSSYNEVRKNLYSDEEKSSTVAYRLINENFPKFLDNIKVYAIAKKAGIIAEGMSEEEQDCLFIVETFNNVLTQKGIDTYNSEIGKVNSAINLYNQQNKKEKDFRKIPKMKELFKQILSDREQSFIDEFTNDEELISKMKAYYEEMKTFISAGDIDRFAEILTDSKGVGVFVKNDTAKTTFSNIVFGRWNMIDERLEAEYDSLNSTKKRDEKYYDKRQKELKKNKSYDIQKIITLAESGEDVIGKYIEKIKIDTDAINKTGVEFRDTVLEKHDSNKSSLGKNTVAVRAIKEYLDAIKDLERDLKLISGSGQDIEKNLSVYSEQEAILLKISKVDSLYNMARNYLTKKPFSIEKVKLNFNSPTLLGGWDRNKEKDYLGVLFLREGKYYLGIIDSNSRKIFEDVHLHSGNGKSFDKIVYKQIPKAAKYLSSKQINPQNPPQIITEILLKKKTDNKSLTRTEIEYFIDYLKDDFLVNYPMIIDEDGHNYFDFHFKDSKDYKTLNDFFKDVERQAYSIKTVPVDEKYIYELVEEGKLYLFEIYNKDFSPYAKGNINLHTIYFKMLFDKRNIKDLRYVLNGEAEVFFRPASISEEDLIIHKAGEDIENKNPKRAITKPTSIFEYDIVKDRRYSKDKFLLHIPVTMNFGVDETRRFNDVVNDVIRKDDKVRVIGIDRGERNLLYVVVVDEDGSILEQISLNSIINKEYSIETDYHKLLDDKEGSRDRARKDWSTIENIKELKEGYLSQVVNVVAKLVLKYNAIICLEDLNFGFKRGRQKVEKQVYQKFEKMLIDKLNYLVIDKSREQASPEKIGGALNALQLTSKFSSFKELGKQTGIIYYVPAYLTSKIDPTTGFSNLFYVKYENMEKARAFLNCFDSISYNKAAGYFEFSIDYKEFTDRACGIRSDWTVCTYGERIIKFRNEEKNNSFDDKTIVLTDVFKRLFEQFGVEYEDGQDLKKQIIAIDDASFYKEIIRLFKLTLQMRNSSADGTRDYIISPVINKNGEFFNSENSDDSRPKDADANGAFNIARKGLWVLEQIRNTQSGDKLNLAMSNAQWLEYAQKNTL